LKFETLGFFIYQGQLRQWPRK